MSVFFQELKKANQDLEAKVNELSSTCTQQKEELLKLASEESGSEVTILKVAFFRKYDAFFSLPKKCVENYPEKYILKLCSDLTLTALQF